MLFKGETRRDAVESRRLLSLRLAAGAGDPAGALAAAESLGLAPHLNRGVRPVIIRLDIEPASLPIEIYASQCMEAGMAFSSGLLDRNIRHIFHCDGSGSIVLHLFLERNAAPAHLEESVAALCAALADSFPHAWRIGGVARGPKAIGEECRHLIESLGQGAPGSRDDPPLEHASPKVREVIRTIRRKEAASDLTIGGLAAAVGITPAHLSLVFRRDMGVSPLGYLTSCRLERAKRLLKNRDLRIHDVALKSGFESAEYFARVFRRHTGMAPTEYRNANR